MHRRRRDRQPPGLQYPPLIKYSDEQANVATGQEITETSFVIRRATDAQLLNDLTCAEVRAMTF